MISWLKKIWKLQTLSTTAILLIITVLVLLFFMRSKPGINRKQILWYGFLAMLLFALIMAFAAANSEDALVTFLIMQTGFILTGILHCWLMYKRFKWASRQDFLPGFLYTLFLVCAGVTLYVMAAPILGMEMYQVWYASSILVFILPYMVLKTFDFAWAIPSLQYKLWYYPAGADVPDPTEYDLADHMKVISIELEPQPGAAARNVKVKAPERMELGHYFMSFIEQYNLRNPEAPITYTDENQMPVGWIFYLKQPWYKSARVFDAEVTVNDNRILENQTIIAERIKYE